MKIYALLLVLMCASQWYVPIFMIVEQEDILRHGEIFRFKTAPVDPEDPFRGKYVTLDFDAETFNNPGRTWHRSQEVFVSVKTGDDGFATVVDVTEGMPGRDADYFTAEVNYSTPERLQLRFPFQRFYLEESKAPDAEVIYQESLSNEEDARAYAVVRIKEGEAALVDVMINDRSIVEIVRELNTTEKN